MEVMFIFGLIDGIQIGYFMKSLAIEFVHDAGSRVEDKLATVLKDKTWCWQPAQ
jgi:hypothetical protein